MSPRDLTPKDRQAIWELFDYSITELGVAYGGLAMRFSTDGRHEASGASVVHLHGHIIEPVIDPATGRVPGWVPGSPSPDNCAVMFKIG